MAFLVYHTSETFINIGASVGKDGINNFDDVYVVQALLRLIVKDYEDNGNARRFTIKFPTGICDIETINAIKNYQHTLLAKGKRSRPVSGLIKKGEGFSASGGIYKSTIYQLNSDLLATVLFDTEGHIFQNRQSNNVLTHLSQYFPKIREMIAKGNQQLRNRIDL